MQRICIAVLAFLLLGSVFPVTPSSAQDATSEAGAHPRLFFSPADLPALRERAKTTHQAIWLAIKEYVDSELGTRPPEVAPVFGSESDYRNYGNQLIAFAFACVIAEDPAYCDLTRDYLLTYAGWVQWDEPGRRDLGLAHMLLGTSIAYDWIYNDLEPVERAAIRDTIARWAHRMHQASTDGYQDAWTNWWANSFIQNHFSTNHSALGIAGLALLGDVTVADEAVPGDLPECAVIADGAVNVRWEPNTAFDAAGALQPLERHVAVAQIVGDDGFVWWQLENGNGVWVRSDVVREEGNCDALPLPAWINPQAWIARAAEQINLLVYLLNGIDDGTWHEGLNYQNYMLSVLLPFLWNLRALEGVDLFPDAYLQNYADWRLYNDLPDTIEPLMIMSDIEQWWGNSFNSQALLRFVAREYQDAHAQWLADRIIGIDGYGVGSYITPWIVFEFLYYDPTVPSVEPTELPLSRTFPDLAGVIWRTGWQADDVIFGLRTGAYGGRYNHDTFVQHLFPWNIPCVAAGCTYNTGHDHADANTFYLYSGGWLATEDAGYGKYDTALHNTVLIDGQGQVIPPNRGVVEANRVANMDGRLDVAVSTANFDFAVADATKRYRVDGMDEYKRSALFVRPDYLVLVDNFRSVIPHEYEWIAHVTGGATLDGNWVHAESSGQRELGIGVFVPAEPEMTTSVADELTAIHLHQTTAGANGRFATLLYPLDTGEWDTRPTLTTLATDDREVSLRVQSNTEPGRTDDIVFAFTPPTAYFDAGPYAHDLRVGVVSYHDPLRPERLFAYGGTFITDEVNGITLVSNLNGSRPFEAVFEDGAIAVTGEVGADITLYAPDAQRLTINGAAATFTRDGDFITFSGDPQATEQAQAD